jgi:trans-2,3-dihydro-3-hydroxyanthranilate isomerase
MRSLPFITVDVFTDSRFAGNPLAVITDGRDLTDTEMQAIAAEFGYSETSFILPPRDPANTAEIRIFTPVTEVPFAGHPNVGTAHVVATLGSLFGRDVTDRLRFEEKAGLVEISVRRQADGSVTGTTIRAPGPLEIGAMLAPEDVCSCLGIAADQIATARHAPVFASVGLKFILIEVIDLKALAAAAPNRDAFLALRAGHPAEFCDCAMFLYTPVGADHLRARMFAPLDNVLEDPATGSASAALGAYLTTLSPPAADHRKLRIEQGVEMGRRSVIDLDITCIDGSFDHVTITGASVEVMRGTITL